MSNHFKSFDVKSKLEKELIKFNNICINDYIIYITFNISGELTPVYQKKLLLLL